MQKIVYLLAASNANDQTKIMKQARLLRDAGCRVIVFGSFDDPYWKTANTKYGIEICRFEGFSFDSLSVSQLDQPLSLTPSVIKEQKNRIRRLLSWAQKRNRNIEVRLKLKPRLAHLSDKIKAVKARQSVLAKQKFELDAEIVPLSNKIEAVKARQSVLAKQKFELDAEIVPISNKIKAVTTKKSELGKKILELSATLRNKKIASKSRPVNTLISIKSYSPATFFGNSKKLTIETISLLEIRLSEFQHCEDELAKLLTERALLKSDISERAQRIRSELHQCADELTKLLAERNLLKSDISNRAKRISSELHQCADELTKLLAERNLLQNEYSAMLSEELKNNDRRPSETDFYFAKLPIYACNFAKLKFRELPDIIHCYGLYPLLGAVLVGKSYGAKVIYEPDEVEVALEPQLPGNNNQFVFQMESDLLKYVEKISTRSVCQFNFYTKSFANLDPSLITNSRDIREIYDIVIETDE